MTQLDEFFEPARNDWVLDLMNRWQFAAGLHQRSGVAAVRDSSQLVVTALEMLFDSPACEQHPFGRLLQRGYLLELAAGLRVASDGLPTRMQRQTGKLCDRIAQCREVDSPLRSPAATLLADIRKLVSFEDASLAHRLRAAIETSRCRTTIADLAHACGTNARYASQAFRREFGMSITKYRREELAHEILNELADGFSVKEIAAKISCGEATVRRIVRASSGCSARVLKRRLIASRTELGMPDEARRA